MNAPQRYFAGLLLALSFAGAQPAPLTPSFLETGGQYRVDGSALSAPTVVEIVSLTDAPWIEVRSDAGETFWLNLNQLGAIYPLEGAAAASDSRVDAIAQACLQAIVSEQYVRRVGDNRYTPLGDAIERIANCDNVAVREIRVTANTFRYVAQHTTSQTTFEVSETGVVTPLD